MDRSRPIFYCSYPECNRSYQRKEHLNRHVASYYQALAAECPCCNRVFARNDTLRQHVRLRHKDAQLTFTRAIRACDNCRSRHDATGPHPLRHVCSAALYVPLCSCSDEIRDNINNHMAQIQAVPVANYIREEVHVYLTNLQRGPAFYPSWPFIHRVTFDPAHEPPFLLQSVLMIGLWVTNEHKMQCAAIELHEKRSLSIYQQRDKWEIPEENSQAQTSWPIATYQGILLQIIFALLQDNQSHFLIPLTRKLPELPTALLTSLVHTCLRQTLFFYPTIVAQFTPGTVPDVFIWVSIEEVKRGSKKSLLSLADLQFAMAESDELWHATSDLAAMLAEDDPMDYSNRNIEVNWISETARLLQKDNVALDWI